VLVVRVYRDSRIVSALFTGICNALGFDCGFRFGVSKFFSAACFFFQVW
jgi:hypothetical protein